MIIRQLVVLTSAVDIGMVFFLLIKLFGLKENIKYPILETILCSIIGMISVFHEFNCMWKHYSYLHGVDVMALITVVYSIIFIKGIFFYKLTIITVTYCLLSTIYNLSFYICIFCISATNDMSYLISNFIITRLLVLLIVYIIFKYKIKAEYNVPCYYWSNIILIPVLDFCFSFILESTRVSPYRYIFSLTGIFLLNILLYISFSKIVNDYEEKISYLMDKQYLQLQLQSYEETQKVYRVLNEFRHDLKNHILCMKIMLKCKQFNELDNYFSQLSNEVSTAITKFNTGNKVIDTVIGAKTAIANSHGIPMAIEIENFIKVNMKDFELSAILSNLLDNAIEASIKIDNPEIKVKILSVYSSIIMIISNKTNDDVLLTNPSLKTTKKDKIYHGIGISVVDGVVKKYGGSFSCYMNEGYFNANVSIPR